MKLSKAQVKAFETAKMWFMRFFLVFVLLGYNILLAMPYAIWSSISDGFMHNMRRYGFTMKEFKLCWRSWDTTKEEARNGK